MEVWWRNTKSSTHTGRALRTDGRWEADRKQIRPLAPLSKLPCIERGALLHRHMRAGMRDMRAGMRGLESTVPRQIATLL